MEYPDHLRALTPSQGAHLLITSRWEEWESKLPLGLFDRDVSIAFLQKRAERQDAAGAEALAEQLGHLPLALEQAAAYCRKAHMSFAEYLAHHQEIMEGKPYSDEFPKSVWGTYTLALDKVIETAPEAEIFMALLAYLAPDDIPLDIISDAVLNPIEKGAAVAALSEVSLIERRMLDDGSPGVSVHRLVQMVMRGRLGDQTEATIALATTIAADAFPAGSDNNPAEVSNWPRCLALYPHAKSVLEQAPDEGDSSDKTALLCNQLAIYLKARADYAEAEPLMRRSLEIDEHAHGPDHPDVAIDLNNLAQLLQAMGRLDEAEPLAVRAVAIWQTSLPEGHPTIEIGQKNLAITRAEIAERDGGAVPVEPNSKEAPEKALKKSFFARLFGK